MKKFLVVIPVALLLAGPTFAGDGGQAVSGLNKVLKEAGTNLGQTIKAVREGDPDFKLGPNVSALNQ